LRGIVGKYTEGRSLGVFGEPRVNVLKVNLEIANILKKNGKL
jgi:K+-transporting ATPase ATPase C chain